ncbi:hypothetical protein [Nostoc sp.]|uniref:hypothetical protein n=1 Tax=Nostoc sp. TaxID=1180 RepID=UPI002FFA1DDD
MFGFDGSTKAIAHFLEQIKENKEGSKFTHREVRAYGRLMLALVPDLSVDHPEEIKLLLAAMSTAGLPHYDRSFAAERILKLLEGQEKRKFHSPDGF